MGTRKEGEWPVEEIQQSNSSSKGRNIHERKMKLKRKKEGGEDYVGKPEVKKRRKKKKMSKAEKVQTMQNINGNKEKCIIYLKRWQEDRQNWKFEKLRQIWLFRNMFDPTKIPDSSFQILVKYISGTQGQARQMVVKKTMKVIKTVEKWTELLEQGLKDDEIASKVPDGKIPEEMYDRARSIIQCMEDV